MIKVTMTLCPGGLEGEEFEEHLGTILIGNNIVRTVQSSGKRGDYSYELFKKRRNKMWRRGKIRDFPRLSYHPWNLVRRILNDAAEANGGSI